MFIETIINRAIALDARTPLRLETIQSKCLALIIKKNSTILEGIAHKQFFVYFTNTGIQLCKTTHIIHDATIKGPLKAFINMALTKNLRSAAQLGLVFEGDPKLLEDIKTLFFSLDIDWEELLAQWTGDIFANQFNTGIKYIKNRFNTLFKSSMESLSEFLKEETQLFPHRYEVEDFINSVDRLRAYTDRLEARITSQKSLKIWEQN